MLDTLNFKHEALSFLSHFKITLGKSDLTKLTTITKAYAHLPYENLTKIIAHHENTSLTTRPLRFPPQVWNDFLTKGTGGTCFSLTYFLYHILTEAGFSSYPVMGHRTYGNNTHSALIVMLDKTLYLVDPGFLLDTPLPLSQFQAVEFSQGFNRLHIEWHLNENIYKVSTLDKLKRKFRYAFSIKPTSWDEFETHWNTSFTWKGMENVVITLKKNDKQIYLHRDKLLILSPSGQTNTKLSPLEMENTFKELGIDKLIVKNAFLHTM